MARIHFSVPCSVLRFIFQSSSHSEHNISLWAKLWIIYHCHKMHSMMTSFKLHEYIPHLDTNRPVWLCRRWLAWFRCVCVDH